jgi:hypothetical protein
MRRELLHTSEQWLTIVLAAFFDAWREECVTYSLGLLAFYCLMIAQSAGAGASYLYPWHRAGDA